MRDIQENIKLQSNKKRILVIGLIVVFGGLVFAHSFNEQENKSKHRKINKRCVELNNSAMSKYHETHFLRTDTLAVDTILQLLDLAIACDTNYLVAYSNKLNILKAAKRFEKAIPVCNEIIRLTNSDPVSLIFKGICFEELDRTDSAEAVFSIVRKKFEKELKIYPDSIKPIIDNIFFIALVEDKEKALLLLDENLRRFPNEKRLSSLRPSIENFSRKDYINRQ